MLTLASCNNLNEQIEAEETAPTVSETVLPDLEAADQQPCRDPGVRAGKPIVKELARNRVALAECRRKHKRVVGFYQGLQAVHLGRLIEKQSFVVIENEAPKQPERPMRKGRHDE